MAAEGTPKTLENTIIDFLSSEVCTSFTSASDIPFKETSGITGTIYIYGLLV